MNVTGWSRGLEVTGGGRGVVSHAGLVLVRQLADRTGLTAGLSRVLASPARGHDRGRVVADLACVIADGGRVISDIRVLADQAGLFGPVASVPTVWRVLREIAAGGERTRCALAGAVSTARRHAWARAPLPPVRVADRALAGVACIRLDATVTLAQSDKELAEPNVKGFGFHPLVAACDNTGEPLAWMFRPGGTGANTAADNLLVLREAIAALPPRCRHRIMVTTDGAGASHALVAELDRLAARRGYQVIYSVGWPLAEREKAALAQVAEDAWEVAIDEHGKPRRRRADGACGSKDCAHQACWTEQAHVTELTPLLRHGPGGDQLAAWPTTMRIFARRERPHPGAKLSAFEQQHGWCYSLWATNRPAGTRGWTGKTVYIDAAHRVHARVEDVIRDDKDTGLGHFPCHDATANEAWLTIAMIACILLAWLKLLGLDGDLARAEPKTLRYKILHTAARLVRGGRRRRLKIGASWPWAKAITTAWHRIQAIPPPT
jgi:Transposase DDE domain group 1